MAESIVIPKTLLKDLYMGLAKVEEVLATREELMDKEGLERTRKAEEEHRKGEYITVKSSSEIKRLAEWRTALAYKAALTKNFLREFNSAQASDEIS